jgi:BirA family biotin operon repressor/biotin-[acetyl-CoA-carboxylase] ligase
MNRLCDHTLPDRALYPRLAAHLPLGIMGRAFYPLRSVDSTQDVAKQLAAHGAPEGTVVVADHQTRGRGRAGRTWLAEPEVNLLFSVLLRPPIPITRVPQLSLLAAVASSDALGAETGFPVRIRWPNDLLLAGRKVAGILTEAASGAQGVLHVSVGIGVNVNQTVFPEEIRQRATSLALVTGRSLDREALLEALLAALDRWYAAYLEAGFNSVRSAWRQHSATLGEWVVSGHGITGTALDLDEDGALLVRLPSGVVERVVAGEVQ